MNPTRTLLAVVAFSLTTTLAVATAAEHSTTTLPRLEKRGAATPLIVAGRPFLILGGETANSISSNLDAMAPVWPRLTQINLNTALVAVVRDWVEPPRRTVRQWPALYRPASDRPICKTLAV